uniref:Putative secreted protein n=1 Tax=Anopheles darlingi TaxID=43151 RepID=A0A2M4DKR5_ANODA
MIDFYDREARKNVPSVLLLLLLLLLMMDRWISCHVVPRPPKNSCGMMFSPVPVRGSCVICVVRRKTRPQ